MKKLKFSAFNLNIETIAKLDNPEKIRGGAWGQLNIPWNSEQCDDTWVYCGCTTHDGCHYTDGTDETGLPQG